ncbi:MAG: hypothetical protein K2G86_02470, partial [Prevotella sp.]|nr:hypothetical protein [Prevotella sp.]
RRGKVLFIFSCRYGACVSAASTGKVTHKSRETVTGAAEKWLSGGAIAPKSRKTVYGAAGITDDDAGSDADGLTKMRLRRFYCFL